MALSVGADSYLSLTDANTYWSDRNNSTWSAASDAEKEKALREATQFIDGAYEFIGETTSTSQVLAWPRVDAEVLRGNFKGVYYDSSTIPPQIENACAELALEALSTRLREVQDKGGAVKREKVDVIEIEYQDWAPTVKSYDFVTMILKPLLTSGGGNQTKLVRC